MIGLMNAYYIAGFPVTDELWHYGVPNMRHGHRRYQDKEGHLTPEGREHYGVGPPLDENGNSESDTSSNGVNKEGTDNAKTQSTGYSANSNYRENSVGSLIEVTDKKRVSEAQKNMLNLGYDLNRFGADGKIGGETRAAINAFKKDHGLKEDGKLDLATTKMIEEESRNSLRKGAKGESVLAMQDTLQSLGYALKDHGSDGNFGPETQRALNEFKKAHGLPENGVYDNATRLAMSNELSARSKGVSPKTTTPAATQQNYSQTPSMQSQQTQSQSQIEEVSQNQNDRTNDSSQEREVEKARKAENRALRGTGKKATEEIINAIDKNWETISSQHKKLTDSISKAAEKGGKSIESAAKKSEKAISSAAKKSSKAISTASKSVKKTADRVSKTFDTLMNTSNTVSASAVKIEKSIRHTTDRIMKNHNKLVSDISKTNKEVRKTAKKARKGIDSFFGKAEKTINKGSKTISSWFGA